MGIGSTSLNLSFSQVIGFHSCKYLQVHRDGTEISSIAVIFQDPGALDHLLLFAGLLSKEAEAVFFGFRCGAVQ